MTSTSHRFQCYGLQSNNGGSDVVIIRYRIRRQGLLLIVE